MPDLTEDGLIREWHEAADADVQMATVPHPDCFRESDHPKQHQQPVVKGRFGRLLTRAAQSLQPLAEPRP